MTLKTADVPFTLSQYTERSPEIYAIFPASWPLTFQRDPAVLDPAG
ncbi:hypothetical protein [Lyngbya confervoides]|uniref:Uncharacterized protein n=1 Tax=Lyngbya confervoides BDU141951 TaxID=1574623 RepID=A0ABD4T8J5_9CYAN|nr:hypothetical protein [Lyngbya confervoides]MCM1985068.1 hypothetical protein [Lyngbya confervoides BDU141951]